MKTQTLMLLAALGAVAFFVLRKKTMVMSLNVTDLKWARANGSAVYPLTVESGLPSSLQAQIQTAMIGLASDDPSQLNAATAACSAQGYPVAASSIQKMLADLSSAVSPSVTPAVASGYAAGAFGNTLVR